LTCLGVAYEQVSARRLEPATDGTAAFLLVCRPLVPAPYSGFLVGTSPAMLSLLEEVEGAAMGDCPVVIRGESGTGKVCVARLLHDLSGRAGGPFVPMDCSEVESSRIERDLFRRKSGSSDRVATDPGLVAAATGGTILLLDPQRLAPSLQSRLGLLLQDRAAEVARCRWLFALDEAAAHPRGNLARALSAASSILVPPLRDRLDDLPLLLDGLTRRFGGAEPPSVDSSALAVLRGYPFPGNLRELESLVERACLVSRGGRLRPEHFPPYVSCLA